MLIFLRFYQILYVQVMWRYAPQYCTIVLGRGCVTLMERAVLTGFEFLQGFLDGNVEGLAICSALESQAEFLSRSVQCRNVGVTWLYKRSFFKMQLRQTCNYSTSSWWKFETRGVNRGVLTDSSLKRCPVMTNCTLDVGRARGEGWFSGAKTEIRRRPTRLMPPPATGTHPPEESSRVIT